MKGRMIYLILQDILQNIKLQTYVLCRHFRAITECLNDEEMQYLRLVSLAGDKLKKKLLTAQRKKIPDWRYAMNTVQQR